MSSCLGDFSLENTQHIADDHMGMCRFSSSDQVDYRKVLAAIDRIVRYVEAVPSDSTRTSLNDTEREAYINSLRFEQFDSRHAMIKPAHAKTCKWLLKKQNYLDWSTAKRLNEHHGLLWIKGKAGCGKSTMLKYIFAHVRRVEPGTTTISFFFNARGHKLEKTTSGMYRSLLLQLFEQMPALQSALNVLPRPRLSSLGDFEGHWHLESLKSIFQSAVSDVGARQLYCFVDALDECHEDEVRDMVTCFEWLCQDALETGTQLHICFSSRHYPHISVEKCLEIVLEGQEGHDQDMTNYLDSELKIGKSQRCEKIKADILEKAKSIFLWLVLVVKILKEEFDRGRVHALQKRLEEIPPGLDDLFRDILTKDGRNSDDLLLCLQWILFSKRPLRREELYFAILAGMEPEQLAPWDQDEVTTSVMDRYILDCSKGLAELTKSKSRTVQFIHESVRDYLLKGNGLAHLKHDGAANFLGSSQERLKVCCQNYLRIELPEIQSSEARILAAISAEVDEIDDEDPASTEVALPESPDIKVRHVTRKPELKDLLERLAPASSHFSSMQLKMSLSMRSLPATPE